MDFIDDEHQMAALKDYKSPEKGQKVKGQQVLETNAHKVKDKGESIQSEGKKSKEKSPKDKSKKSKKSKTKAALKQPPPEVLAAEINASINSLKSPSDVPDDLSMPFTLPGFEEFEQQETQAKHEKHKNSSKSKKKSKKDKEKEETLNSGVSSETLSVVGKETPSKSEDSVRQVDMLPDTITFTENELSDVLDQVESLGQSLSASDANASTPKSQAAVIIESVLDTPKFPPPTTPTTPSEKKSKSRKKKSTFETPDLPPSKKKRVSPGGGSNPGTAADILERAMEGIGPLDMDCSDPHDATGDGADADKMTIDLSAHSSESDHNLDSPPFIPTQSPSKLSSPSSAKKKSDKNAVGSGCTKGHESDASEVLDDSSASVPTFGYSPVKSVSDNREKLTDTDRSRRSEEREHENGGSRDRSGKDDVIKEKVTTPQISSSASFYNDMDGDLTINTETSRTEKQNSPSPVSMVRSSLLDIIPPMTPRTVDHLAKTLGCDPVTPFDGDSLANMDNDDYPWLNTPNLAPATPAQARHTNIASLARFDARPVATPKHPVTKSDSKSSFTSNQFNSQSKSVTSDAKLSTGSSSTKPEVTRKSDKKDKPQEKSVNGPEQTGSSFTAPMNYTTNAPKPQPTLTIPPFNSPEKPSGALTNQLQANSHNISPNISQSSASSSLRRQSSNNTLDKPGQSVSSSKTQDDSRGSASAPGATSPASLKPPGSNSSSSSTSPVKQTSNNSGNSSNNTKLSPQAGSGFSSSNRLSPAGSGKKRSSIIQVHKSIH